MAVICAVLLLLASTVSVRAQEAITVSSSAASAVLYEPSAGRVLFEQNAHVKRPMASTTKLMTALLAVEMLPQDTVLIASAEALAVEGSSLGLRVGDTVTRDDLLYGLLLSSGNDAANVFALTIADSYEAFAQLMNTRAAAIGMTNTQFVTPSGLDAEGHGASAYDMALLAAEVLKNEQLRTVCATVDTTITVGDRQVSLHNHNRLLSLYEGAVGMKTGYTSKAGRCLVSAATRSGVTLIAVTLDCGNDWEEHQILLDEGFARLEAVTLSPSIPSSLTVLGGEGETAALTASPVSVTVLSDDAQAIEQSVQLPAFVWAPVTAGETVGTVEYSLRGALLASVPVTLEETVIQTPRSPWWQKVKVLFCQLLAEALT